MESVRVPDLKVGMILAEDVRDMNGRRLLSAGSSINDKCLHILNTWGILDVMIKPVISGTEAPPGELAEIEEDENQQEISELFSLISREDPLIQELWRKSLEAHGSRGYSHFLEYTEEPAPLQRSTLPASPDAVIETAEFTTLPEVYHHILEVINNEKSSTMDISDVITKDPSFTSRILNLANSSFYALKNSVDTVSKAVSIIGTRELGTLALGITISRSLLRTKQNDYSLLEFWRHSVATAIAARTLAIFLKEKNTERYFIGGLLHDMGKLLLYSRLREGIYYLDFLSRKHRMNLHSTEKSILGFTHADVGSQLCVKWNLPENLHSMIGDHHNVARSMRSYEATIIHFADIIANSIKKGTSGEPFIPPVQRESREFLQISPSAVAAIVSQIENNTDEIAGIMLHD